MKPRIMHIFSTACKFISNIVLLLFIIVAGNNEAIAQICETEYKRPWHKSRSAFCVIGEQVQDGYFPDKFYPCEEMEVDHMVALFYAYQQGVCGDELKRIANDPDNLVLTHWTVNRAKGAKPPREFALGLPANDRNRIIQRIELVEKKFQIEPLYPKPLDVRYSMLAQELEHLRAENTSLRATRGVDDIDASIFRIVTRMKKRIGKVILAETGGATSDLVPAKGVVTGSAMAVIGFGLLAAEIKSSCGLAEDLNALEAQLRLQQNPDAVISKRPEAQLCGMSASELFYTIAGGDLASKTCAELRQENPLGEFEACDGISFYLKDLEPKEPEVPSVLLDE